QQFVAVQTAGNTDLHLHEFGLVQHLPRLHHAAGGVEVDHPRRAAVRSAGVLQPLGTGRQRVVQARQVLNEAEFMQVQVRVAGGLDRDELLRWIGHPGERRRGGWAGGEVWSWRYPTNDCLWFQVSVSDSGWVTGGAFAIDPVCDAPSERD
ncbi:MAG: hypothetical protein IH627_00285, partial [Rubrivivax sp.]|nr:hypothetical protein [Rubrivivax sp.]